MNKKCLSCIHCEVCSFIDSDTAKLESCDFYDAGYNEVLDKIKVDIEKRADDYFASGSYDKDLYNGAYKDALYWCFDLIDKYKAESEG